MTDQATLDAIDKAEVMPTLAGKLSMDPLDVQRMLFDVYDPWWVWVEIGMIGLVSLGCMMAYDLAIRYVDREEKAA